jgi:hypothetical protein
MQEAELVLRKMIKKGITPGRSAYTALKNWHVTRESLNEAFRTAASHG